MIRVWQEKDTPAVAKIERNSFSHPWTEEMLSASLNSPAFYGLVWDEGEVFGYVGALCVDDGEIALIAVDKEHRRKGIAKKLLLEAERIAVEKGCMNMFLEVRVSNDGAKALYQSCGYVPVSIRKKYYENGEDAIVMVKPLVFAKE